MAATAGFLLMEMAARITIVTGESLGRGIRRRYGRWWPPLLFGAVVFGCAAYQAGNLTGALGGLQLLVTAPRWVLLPLALSVAALLWWGNTLGIGRLLALVVAGMGALFVWGATDRLLGGGLTARPPSELDARLVVGLVGTTIVPYNFFLAAGLGYGGQLAYMRRGLLLSFAVGALITVGIVVTGGALAGFGSFAEAAAALTAILGDGAGRTLGAGLFAAGLSSALTAPLAAAVAGREMLGGPGWSATGRWFRLCRGGVLATGLLVGLSQLNMVSIILTAQVINGFLVPLIGILVLLLANDRRLLGNDRINTPVQNLLGGLLVLFLTYRNAELLGGVAGCQPCTLPAVGSTLVVLLLLIGGINAARRSPGG